MFCHLEKSYGFLLGIILICLVGCSNRQQSSRDLTISAGQELSQRVDEITNTFNKYPKEGQLHLAAADLYRFVGGIANEPRAHPGKEYEIAVQLEPKNRLARALWMKYVAERHTGAIARYYRDMEEAKKRGGSVGKVRAANIRKRAASRRPELDEKTRYLLEELNISQDIDPDNALYNYLSASIYFVGGEKQKAIGEIEKGLKKKYVSLYTKQRIEARQRLLDEIDFPSPERENFLMTSAPLGMREPLCEDLIEMGKECQKGWYPSIIKLLISIYGFQFHSGVRDNVKIGQYVEKEFKNNLAKEILEDESKQKRYLPQNCTVDREQCLIKDSNGKIIYLEEKRVMAKKRAAKKKTAKKKKKR